MYTVVPKKKRKSEKIEDIVYDHDGKWLYLTNVEYKDMHERDQMTGGVVVVVADSKFEGKEKGIYKEFDKLKYCDLGEVDLTYDIIEPYFIAWSGYDEIIVTYERPHFLQTKHDNDVFIKEFFENYLMKADTNDTSDEEEIDLYIGD